VSCRGVPPAADTFERDPLKVGEKTIVSSRFQLPPRPSGASQITCDGPPAASIFLSLPSAKNPMKRLLADQKGYVAPAVPGSGWLVAVFSALTQSDCLPSTSVAPNTSRVPSGEIASGAVRSPTKANTAFSGSGM